MKDPLSIRETVALKLDDTSSFYYLCVDSYIYRVSLYSY
jgi:hypothetical protein